MSSSSRSAGTCASVCPTATSRSCWPSVGSRSTTSRSTVGCCGSRRCWPTPLGRVGTPSVTAGELAEQLQWALEHRVLIEQAKGVLMEREGLSPAAAFARLRSAARAVGCTVGSWPRSSWPGGVCPAIESPTRGARAIRGSGGGSGRLPSCLCRPCGCLARLGLPGGGAALSGPWHHLTVLPPPGQDVALVG
jgi:hypothetical protein